jgi:hypothetical protein
MRERFAKRLCTGAFFLFIFILAVTASAQNARFTGQVADAQGAVIPQAKIDILNLDTNAHSQATSDDSGVYSVPFLTAGHYRIIADAPGFETFTQEVNLGMGEGLTFNIQMAVKGDTTVVNVQAGNELTQLHLESNEVSGTIVGKEVAGLQLNGRNFSQLIALAPGVSNQTSQDEARVGLAGSVSYSVNGGRTEYNSFQVDGSETLNTGINRNHNTLIVYPSIDAIQEIKVLTSNYGAQYPSTGNGTTIVTTKSGTDTFHGSLYEFFRNEALNAKGYFDVGNRAPLYRRNDFGGTIGGPVYIPHVYNGKGKTHFFFSEEARLEKDPYAYRQAVPSLAERNGDFSDVCPAVANGEKGSFTRAKYPDCPDGNNGYPGLEGNGSSYSTFVNNQLTYPGNSTNSTLSQNALAILSTGFIPLPTATNGCNTTGSACYNADVSLPTYWRQELFRIDHTINANWSAGFRYIHDEWNETTPVPLYAYTQNSFPSIQNKVYGPGLSLVARVSGAFSPTFLNEFTASYTDQYITLSDQPNAGVSLTRPPSLSQTTPCTSTTSQCPLSTIFDNGGKGIDGVPKVPGVSIAGNNAVYGGFGFAVDPGYTPWEHTNPVYSFGDNLTKVLGRHNFQFGAQWMIWQRNQTNGPIGATTGDTQGLLTFTNLKTTQATGNAFADFLYTDLQFGVPGGSGDISSFQQDSAQSRYRQRFQIVEPYFQDDFKVSPRLTLNAGLRLSLFGTYHEANNQAYNWETSAFNTAAAKTVSVDTTYGNLVNVATSTPIPLNQSNPTAGLDPRIINGIVQCGVNGRPASCMSGHLFNPAPRVGFAWDPTGAGKMSLRGGYGIFFEHGTADEANTGSLEGAAPVVLNMTQTNPAGWGAIGQTFVNPPGQWNNGTAFPINVTAIPTKVKWTYVQQWSLSVERQLPWNALATVAYVGSTGTHLTAEREINQLVPLGPGQIPFGAHQPLQTKGANPNAPVNVASIAGDCTFGGPANKNAFYLLNGAVIAPGDTRYPNIAAACYISGTGIPPNALRTFAPGIGEIYSLENVANSNYNGLQVTARKVSGPLTLGVSYSYSHSIDNASDRSDATFVNSFNLASNRASSNFDQRHLLHISYIYELPVLHALDGIFHFADSDPTNTVANPGGFSDSRAAKAILNGWQVSGITLFETGIPFTVVNNGSPQGVGALDNAGVGNGVGAGSYPDRSGFSAKTRVPAGGKNSQSFGPLLLNPIAFVAPQGLTFGNAGRNDLNNPSRWNWDVTLLKHNQFGERVNGEFRIEAFNIFNNTQFRIYDPVLGTQPQNTVSCYGGPVSYYSSGGGDGIDCLTGSSFLHPVDAHRPRTIQFALKLSF